MIVILNTIYPYLMVLAWFLILMIPFICYMAKGDRWSKLRLKLKKWLWLVILSPFIIYTVGTLLLMLVRGDCFTAYHVYIGEHHFISYNDETYVEFTNTDEIVKMYEEVDGRWSEEEQYVLREQIKFPYAEYWVLDMFLECFVVSDDGKYMMTNTLGGQRNYRRAEE